MDAILRPVDQQRLMALEQARKERHRVTRCERCGGPMVHSKREGAVIERVRGVPSDLDLRMMNGRARLDDIAPYMVKEARPTARCFGCGETNHMAARSTFRRCVLCGGDMTGTDVRSKFCGRCLKLPRRERDKRMQWKRQARAKAA